MNRLPGEPGERNRRALFTNQQAAEIREELAGGAHYRDIAAREGCSPITVWNLKHYKHYPKR